MSKKILYLLGIAITIILGTLLYLKFCCNCCEKTTTESAEKPVSTEVQKTNFVPFVLNGSGIDYQTTDNLKFLKNSAMLIMPVGNSIKIGIDKLKSFLAVNPRQKVTITGYAISDEKNTTTFENLAVARANEVKNYFVSEGLSEAQFNIKGEITDKWKTVSDTLYGPVSLKFDELDTEKAATDEWSILKDKINADPLILHFNTNKSSDALNSIEKQKVSDIVNYTNHEKEASILVVGHSDNVGNRDANVVLAQKRADFTKNYLAKKGIDASRIETESKGPDEPLGENNTAEGKAANRRTVITIK